MSCTSYVDAKRQVTPFGVGIERKFLLLYLGHILFGRKCQRLVIRISSEEDMTFFIDMGGSVC